MFRDPSLVPLSHQHQHGLALTVIIERGLKADPSDRKAAELSAKVAAMAEAELLGHFKVEEDVLFPAIRASFDSGAIVGELIEQHREMERLIKELAQASSQQRAPLLKEFGELLSRHIRIEERQLFQEVQAKLSPEELGRLGEQIETNVQKICPITDQLPWEESSSEK